MKKLLYTAILFLSPTTTVISVEDPATETEIVAPVPNYRTTEINNSYTTTERKVRDAAVRITSIRGHGTGGLIEYKGMQLVLTAHHVADGTLGDAYLVSTQYEQQLGVLIYKDPLNDISLLYLPMEVVHSEPMRYRTNSTIVEVGEDITYSGFPTWHNLLSFRGHVAGFEVLPESGQQIILQTYGYFGCSGAVVYDSDGNILGVLWGIDVQRQQIQQNIVWVSPIQNLNIDLALSGLCAGMPEKPRACR
jgi:S1-C subfamily serine protease